MQTHNNCQLGIKVQQGMQLLPSIHSCGDLCDIVEFNGISTWVVCNQLNKSYG